MEHRNGRISRDRIQMRWESNILRDGNSDFRYFKLALMLLFLEYYREIERLRVSFNLVFNTSVTFGSYGS